MIRHCEHPDAIQLGAERQGVRHLWCICGAHGTATHRIDENDDNYEEVIWRRPEGAEDMARLLMAAIVQLGDAMPVHPAESGLHFKWYQKTVRLIDEAKALGIQHEEPF
jgi:hypothetical protein